MLTKDKQVSTLYPKTSELYGVFRPELLVGFVCDIATGARCYSVDVDGRKITCADANGSTGFHMFGLRRIGFFQLGSSVVVMCAKHSDTGIILGGLPGQVGAVSMNIVDHVHGFTGSSAYNDVTEYYPTKMVDSGGVVDYCSNRPVDATPGSDGGEMNELGVGYGVSRLYAWIRASELAGLTCFHTDNFVRLAAYNFEMWTAGSERNVFNDSGEVNDVETSTPFHWEAVGWRHPGSPALKRNTEGGWFKPGQDLPLWSPIRDDQVMLHRRLKIGGYIGDSSRDMVVMPEDMKIDKPQTLGHRSRLTGLSDIQQHLDGLLAIRSARGIVLEKYIFLPVPKQIAKPEEAKKSDTGDSVENYAAAGSQWGDIKGPEAPHRKLSWRMPSEQSPSATAYGWMAAAYDAHGYLLNELSNRAITAHEKDWYLPEEGEENVGTQPNEAAYKYKAVTLEGKFTLPLPRFAELKIDHRWISENPRYYYARSAIEQMPDGSILIEDGYGASIFMSGGHIYLSCPGDVWTMPGRSAITWAADDVVVKAGQSIDITASNKDVRVKAERNLHMLAGNDKKQAGGIVLECRSDGELYQFLDKYGEDVISSGITLKAKKSPILVYGDSVYARSLTKDLILDAGEGDRQDIAVNHKRWIGKNAIDVFGVDLTQDTTPSADNTGINVFSKDTTVLGGKSSCVIRANSVIMVPKSGSTNVMIDGSVGLSKNLAADGNVALKGTLQANGSIACRGASVAAAHVNLSGVCGKLVDLPDALTIDMAGAANVANSAIQSQESVPLQVAAETHRTIYAENRPGNEEFINQLGFTCRIEKQYRLTEDDFIIAESRWQQWYRQDDQGYDWIEPEVDSPWDGGQATQPHPGNKMWTTAKAYGIYDAQIWSWEKSMNGTRAKEPKNKAADMQKKVLKDFYKITVNHEE